ncbi:MAG TPA: thioredoxin domain-containing protein [Bdellovibrionota bacterium]|jgi:hypothetical protein
MNRLAEEKSPYLRQHAGNPVDWYPWGEEAFAKAKRENKPVFLSIGYSTCYWCHVMEKECFEVEDVAEVLNSGFVSVKVDREEHPEVDEIYMDAVMAMTGQGGWPMSVFLTPEREPFWGGTYVPRPHFLQLMEKISEAWKETPDQIRTGGKRLTQAIRDEAPPAASDSLAQAELFRRFEAQAESRYEPEFGGFSPAPKFPSGQTIRLLLRLYKETGTPQLLGMAERSLEAMACGGIYDQLGGGFHRYSTDERWLVPHFEKMLYDNALLVPAYLEAFQLTGRKMYADVARETLHYMLRDLKAPGGAFFSAEDAGEVGAEGEFYVWKLDELKKTLGERLMGFQASFPLSEMGNFEHGTNVLHLQDPKSWDRSRDSETSEARTFLLGSRSKRKRPHRDEKILTSWNGLALSALAFGYRVLGDERFLEAAKVAAAWIQANLWKDGVLLRRHCDGQSRYNGTASDYAFLIQGLIELYEASFDQKWLLWARELQDVLDRSFWNEMGSGYFTASHDEPGLITRKVDRHDGALPSPNSVAYGNLLRLSQFFLEPGLDDRASDLFFAHGDIPERIPLAVSCLLLGLHLRSGGGPRVLVIAGAKAQDRTHLLGAIRGKFLPNLILAAAEPDSSIPLLQGKSSQAGISIYICEDGVCHPPTSAKEALEGLS